VPVVPVSASEELLVDVVAVGVEVDVAVAVDVAVDVGAGAAVVVAVAVAVGAGAAVVVAVSVVVGVAVDIGTTSLFRPGAWSDLPDVLEARLMSVGLEARPNAVDPARAATKAAARVRLRGRVAFLSKDAEVVSGVVFFS